MDDVTRRRIEAFDRSKQWFIDHDAGVNSNLKLKTNRQAFDAELTALQAEVGEQTAAVSESQEQTEVKATDREDCVQIAVKVNIAANGAEIEQPGIQARYPYPRNLNDEDLVALLRSYAIGGVTDDQIIQDYAAPADWVAQCTARADEFEAASNAQSSAQGSKVGKRASILAKVAALMQRKRTCNSIIEGVFADDVAALASWKSASHVENPPKKKKPPTPPDNGNDDDDPPPTP